MILKVPFENTVGKGENIFPLPKPKTNFNFPVSFFFLAVTENAFILNQSKNMLFDMKFTGYKLHSTMI